MKKIRIRNQLTLKLLKCAPKTLHIRAQLVKIYRLVYISPLIGTYADCWNGGQCVYSDSI